VDAPPSELSAAALHGESGDLHGAAGAGVGKGLALPGATGAVAQFLSHGSPIPKINGEYI